MILTILDRRYEIFVPWEHQQKIYKAAYYIQDSIEELIRKSGKKVAELLEEEEKSFTLEALKKIEFTGWQARLALNKLTKGLAQRIINAIGVPDFKWPSIRDEDKWNFDVS